MTEESIRTMFEESVKLNPHVFPIIENPFLRLGDIDGRMGDYIDMRIECSFRGFLMASAITADAMSRFSPERYISEEMSSALGEQYAMPKHKVEGLISSVLLLCANTPE